MSFILKVLTVPCRETEVKLFFCRSASPQEDDDDEDEYADEEEEGE